ncbi:MAG: MmgE/PrpD family protein [Deltaproteobacteria bacterium]|nr:MmgE/PrpD family protein [Deltaproteobacteria bacterium]
MKETMRVAQNCCELNFHSLPEKVIEKTKDLLLDYIGVAARGALSDSSTPVQSMFERIGRHDRGAVVIGTDLSLHPLFAAMANGIAAHSLELDDVVNTASVHPGVVIISAALAAAQADSCAGTKMIEAIVAGYEAMVKIGAAMNPGAHYARGFHPTGTCGVFGAAITASKIFNLDASQTTCALGIAGSQAAGSMEFLSDGSFTKRFHPGWSAHSGMMAAFLAQEGFTGPRTILEGKFGFLNAYSSKPDRKKILENWADPYEVLKTSIKPHACCRYKQGPIDGVLEVMKENAIKAEDVEKVTVAVLKAGFPLIAEPAQHKYRPASIVDAQFSMPFGAAVAILYGKASLDQYTLENIRSAKVKKMMDRVVMKKDPELEKVFPEKWPARVVIETKDGKKFFKEIEHPKGDPENPLTRDEIVEKFKALVHPVFNNDRIYQIIDRVSALEKMDDVQALCELLGK